MQMLWGDDVGSRISAFAVAPVVAGDNGDIHSKWSSKFSQKFGNKDFMPPTVVDTADAGSATKFHQETGWPARLNEYPSSTVNKMISLLNISNSTNGWGLRLREATEYFAGSVTLEMVQSKLDFNLRRELYHWKSSR